MHLAFIEICTSCGILLDRNRLTLKNPSFSIIILGSDVDIVDHFVPYYCCPVCNNKILKHK